MSSETDETERQGRGFLQRMNDWFSKDSNKDPMSIAMSRPYTSRADYGNYDYYDDSPVRRGDHHGGFGHGGGYGGYCMEDQVSIGLLVVSLAGIGLMWYTLYTKIQANGGRKKRETDSSWFTMLGDNLVSGKSFKLQPYQFVGSRNHE